MDWFSTWEPLPYPVPYMELEHVRPPADGGFFTAWLVLAVILLAATAMSYRPRVAPQVFWCATAGRDVEACVGRGRVQSCSAFEDARAIACTRRCLDRSFRAQGPPAVPGLAPLRWSARSGL